VAQVSLSFAESAAENEEAAATPSDLDPPPADPALESHA
jgi:hypothetical protein